MAGFNHGQQLGLSASCTPASTYAVARWQLSWLTFSQDPVEHYLDLPGAVEINSAARLWSPRDVSKHEVSHGTCMSIQQIIPWTLVDRMYNRCHSENVARCQHTETALTCFNLLSKLPRHGPSSHKWQRLCTRLSRREQLGWTVAQGPGRGNQKWFMVEGAIISMHGGKFECLDYHTGTENVYMHECHGNSNQQLDQKKL